MTETEIDEAVAKKLGLEFHPRECLGGEGVYGRWVVCGKHWHKPGHKTHSYKLPPYSTSIQAAWEIVEHLAQDYAVHVLTGFKRRSKFAHYSCDIGNHPGLKDHWVISESADTAPLAICRAFLKLP